MLLALTLLGLTALVGIATRFTRPGEIPEITGQTSAVNRLYGRANTLEPKVIFVFYAGWALINVFVTAGDLNDGLRSFLMGVWLVGAVTLASTVLMGLAKGRLQKFSLIGLAWRSAALYLLWSTDGVNFALVALAIEALYRVFNAYVKWASWSVAKEKEEVPTPA